MNHRIIILLISLLCATAKAQRSEIFVSTIASLQVVPGNNWMEPLPVISLSRANNGNDSNNASEGFVTIAFDELSHDYHRYTYTVQHCEADWTPSEELLESDYVDGFASGNTIDDYGQSVNTNTPYTHYKLTLPNDRCRLKLSGNYTVTVHDEDTGNTPVLKACLMVTEQSMKSAMEQTANTDIDINGSHQQLSISLNFGSNRVTSPSTQIKTVVLQNGRWDNCVCNPKPQYIRADGMAWDHNRSLVFPAGNEYHKFEILDPTHTTMGLERVGWDGKHYNAWVFMDEPRPNYIYDEDVDGAFCIRNSDNINNNTQSDYILTHFTLKASRQTADVYLNGAWTQDNFDEHYRMTWNENDGLYEAVVPLKQGYYNYQYLLMRADGTTVPLPSQGNYYQTENSYQLLVYFRGQGERTDRLVNYLNLSSRLP